MLGLYDGGQTPWGGQLPGRKRYGRSVSSGD